MPHNEEGTNPMRISGNPLTLKVPPEHSVRKKPDHETQMLDKESKITRVEISGFGGGGTQTLVPDPNGEWEIRIFFTHPSEKPENP